LPLLYTHKLVRTHRAGVPIVTYPDTSLASRVSASLLLASKQTGLLCASLPLPPISPPPPPPPPLHARTLFLTRDALLHHITATVARRSQDYVEIAAALLRSDAHGGTARALAARASSRAALKVRRELQALRYDGEVFDNARFAQRLETGVLEWRLHGYAGGGADANASRRSVVPHVVVSGA
jgi:hypothetical protein